MRAVTPEELDRIVGGLLKNRPVNIRRLSLNRRNHTLIQSSPPVSVIGTGPSSTGGPITTGPGGGGSSVPSSVAHITGGGGGGVDLHNNPLGAYYDDGTHTIDKTTATEKFSPASPDYHENNAGNITWNPTWEVNFGGSEGTNGFAQFTTAQGGVNAAGALLDGAHYGNDNMVNFVTDGWNAGSPSAQLAEQNNVINYMDSNGYPSVTYATTQTIDSLSNAEFNTFLDAVINAEGQMKL